MRGIDYIAQFYELFEAFTLFACVYLGVRTVEIAIKLYDRFQMNKVAKDLAKQLEEEEAYEKERCKGKHFKQ